LSAISVVVVDDHDLLREGVSACLASFDDIDVVGEASNGEAALRIVASLQPAVVVMDLVMPGLSGSEVIRRLRAEHPDLGIVALSSFSESSRVRDVIDAGANGYLIKSVDAPSLARAVRSAAVGQSTFSAEVTHSLMDERPEPNLSGLTAREDEIAGLLASGRTNAEIAAQLDLSVFTVKNHVSSILMKLHVRTRTEAASVILRAAD
jgi:NarL family two-component system response regulator LiaR